MHVSHPRRRWHHAVGLTASLFVLLWLAVPGLAAQGGNGSVNTQRSLKSEAKAAEAEDEILGIAFSNAAVVTAPGTSVSSDAFDSAFVTASSLPVVGG